MNKFQLGLLPLAFLSAFGGRAIAQDSNITTTPDSSTPATDSSSASTSGGSAPVDSSSSSNAIVDPGSAGLPPELDEPLDTRLYIVPMGAYALSPSEGYKNFANTSPQGPKQKDGYGGALALGLPVARHLSAEVLGTYLHYRGQKYEVPNPNAITALLNPTITAEGPSHTLYGGGLGLNAYLSPTNYGVFIHGDAQDGNHFVYNGGVGIDFPFTSHDFAVRAEALYHKENNFRAEPLFQVGLRIELGSKPAPPAPPPEPVAVVPPVEAPPPPPPPPPCQTPAPGEPITMEGCKAGDTIILRGVNFDFNKATLTLNAKTILDQVATALTSRSDIKVELDGHTDGKGSGPYNLKLSDRRAKSVKQYLVGKGIDTGRMTTKGFGKTMPIADNATQEGRDLNRRVELKVTESNGAVGDSLSTAVPVSSGASDSSSSSSTPPADSAPPAPPADTSAPAPDASTPPQ